MSLPGPNALLLLLSAIVSLCLPAVVFAYYLLRVVARQERLIAKLRELKLEAEYLRLFHYEEWQKVEGQGTVEGRGTVQGQGTAVTPNTIALVNATVLGP